MRPVYADWCGPCKTISPVFESLSTKFSKPRAITFTKVNVDNQQEIAQKYGVSAYVSPPPPTSAMLYILLTTNQNAHLPHLPQWLGD
jgi:thiol-disulfide isomerase/thioredoxin